MLSAIAQAEIGALEINGMVHPHYSQISEPFQGEFWQLVVGEIDPATLPENLVNVGLELEIITNELGLWTHLATAIGLVEAAEGDLANAFACSLFCQRSTSELVKPLSVILAENLGKAFIANVLYRKTGVVDISMSSHDLAIQLLTAVGLT
jgi:hypothetical protein